MSVSGVLRRLFVLGLTSLAPGCYESATPLNGPQQAPLDSRLIGAWRCVGPDTSDDAMTITTARSPNGTYAITWEEPGKKPDHYEGYLAGLKDTMVLNVREVTTSKASQWSLVHVDLLQPDIALIKVVSETLLEGQSPAAVRTTLEQQNANPALYEKVPLVCIRARK
jgi:hypothetical protein